MVASARRFFKAFLPVRIGLEPVFHASFRDFGDSDQRFWLACLLLSPTPEAALAVASIWLGCWHFGRSDPKVTVVSGMTPESRELARIELVLEHVRLEY